MRWVLGRRRESASVRLLCFAHAGGGASEFATWAEGLPPGIDVCPVQLPGRQGRLAEEPLVDWAELVDAVTAGLDGLADRPWALFGHSFGALVALELARRLETVGRPVHHLVVAGCHAPHAVPAGDPAEVAALDDDTLAERIARRTGGPGVLADPELRGLVMPALRADMMLVAGYRAPGGPRLSCPVTVLGADDDTYPVPADLDGWDAATTGPCRTLLLDGGHFFPATRRRAVLDLLADLLADLLTPVGPRPEAP